MVGVNISSFAEHISREHDVQDLSVNGKCSQCGGCCSNSLRLTKKEIERIKKYVKRYNIKPHVTLLPIATRVLDVTCPFLDTSKKTERCKIYPVRPYICQVFNCSDTSIDKYVNDPKFITEERISVDMRQTFYPNK